MATLVNIGFIQFDPIFGEVEYNIAQTIKLISLGKNANLLVLPELANTGSAIENIAQVAELAEKIPNGKTIQAWIKVTEETNTFIVGSMVERSSQGKFYKTAVIIGPHNFITTYRKQNLFNEEKKLFSQGNNPTQVFDIGQLKIGIVLCSEWRSHRRMKSLVSEGADIVCHLSNSSSLITSIAMEKFSKDFHIISITANRIGTEMINDKEIHFTGQSQVINRKGRVILRAGKNEVVKICRLEV